MLYPDVILWNHKSPIKWHFGEPEWTVEQIKNDPSKKFMLDQEVVLFVDDEGLAIKWTLLEMWKAQYSVTEDDPEKALEICITRSNIAPTTIADLEESTLELSEGQQEIIDSISLVEDAILELSVLMMGE